MPEFDVFKRAVRGSSRPVQGNGSERWHGTQNGYVWHRCGCERCCEAHRDHVRAWRGDNKVQSGGPT